MRDPEGGNSRNSASTWDTRASARASGAIDGAVCNLAGSASHSWWVLIASTSFRLRRNVMADDLTDLEIAVLCDLLDGPGANLKAYKRAVLDQLVAKGLVEPAKGEPAKFQLSDKAHHLLAERGVGISGG